MSVAELAGRLFALRRRRAHARTAARPARAVPEAPAGSVGRQLAAPLQGFGAFVLFCARTLALVPAVLLHATRRRETLLQMDAIGVGALPITHITGFIAGLLLGLQTHASMRQFGVTEMFAKMLALALVREVGPTFVALVAGARAASGITSELATMSVTQQVDALRALRHDPLASLAAPRVAAAALSMPLLAIAGVLAGLFGGMLVGLFVMQQPPSFFFHQAMTMIGIRELVPNLLVKPAAFGLLIGFVSTWLGLGATGGTRAVGAATVRSVVMVTVGVLVVDYAVGEAFRAIWPPPPW